MAAQMEDTEDHRDKRSKKNGKKAKRAARRSQIVVDLDGSSEDEEAGHHDILQELQIGKNDSDRLKEMTSLYALEAVQDTDGHSLSLSEESKLVRSVMRFMLFRQMQRPGVPVKRDDLHKLIPSSYKSQRIHNLGTFVITKAQAQFPALFGMEMKEVRASRTASGDGAKMYVLRSLLDHPLRRLIRVEAQEHNQALLMVLLPLFLLNGGKMADEEIYLHLGKIGIDSKADHPTFRRVPESLQLLVQKRYLSETTENGSEGNYKVYTIGPLAMDEIQEDNIRAFMEAVFKNKVTTG